MKALRTMLAFASVTALMGLSHAPALASAISPDFVEVPSLAGAAVSGSAVIDGLRGGRLVVGRYAITVPPGAIMGRATVTLSVPDRTTMRCELRIAPASLNRFVRPVILEADCSGWGTDTVLPLVKTVTFDESKGIWLLVPNVTVNVANKRVYTPLWHFSQYGQVQGKAGW